MRYACGKESVEAFNLHPDSGVNVHTLAACAQTHLYLISFTAAKQNSLFQPVGVPEPSVFARS